MAFSSLEINQVDEPSGETTEPESAGTQAQGSLRSALLYCPLFCGMSPPLPRRHCSPALLVSWRVPPCYPPPRALRGTDWSSTKLQPPDHSSHFGANSLSLWGVHHLSCPDLCTLFLSPLRHILLKKERKKENHVSIYLAVPGLSCSMKHIYIYIFSCGMWGLIP